MEHGDRGSFLALLRTALTSGVEPSHLRPIRELPESLPEPTSPIVGIDPVEQFVEAAHDVSAVVHVIEDRPDLSRACQAIVDVTAPSSIFPNGDGIPFALTETLCDLGGIASTHDCADADLVVGVADHGISVTGSIVVSTRHGARRSAWFLPRILVLVLDEESLLTSTSALFRLRLREDLLPSAVTLMTGPSRTGDIEQILTLGVHGPTTVHVLLIRSTYPRTEVQHAHRPPSA